MIELALKLAEERKFKDLYLRLLDEHGCLITTCVRDERLLIACARAVPNVDPACNAIDWTAIQIVQLLVKNGADKRRVFQTAARFGNLDLLEAARARGWSDESTYGDVFFAAAEGGGALAVLKWLVHHRATLDSGDDYGCLDGGNWIIHDSLYGCALHWTLVNEDIDAAAYLLDHSRDLFVRCSDTEPNKDIVIGAANEGALKSLDFLCERWGVDFVTTSVDLHEPASGFDPEYQEEIKYWLKQRLKGQVKEHLMNAMATLDTVKERLPEGAYLKITSDMQEAYKGCNYISS